MDYNININKICRVCLEEGVLTSIFNTEFAMMPAEMIMLCAKIKVLIIIAIVHTLAYCLYLFYKGIQK